MIELSRSWRLSRPLDLRLTLAPFRHGPFDPSIRLRRRAAWRATRTPDGPAAQHLEIDGDHITVTAWGGGADYLLDTAPVLVGEDDDPASFRPRDPIARKLVQAFPGLRLGRTDNVVEALVPTILEQKVQSEAAHDAYAHALRSMSGPAPGPVGLVLPPDPSMLARSPYWTWHRFGVERRRAETIRYACSRAAALERSVAAGLDTTRRALSALPGVGPWTVEQVCLGALGDADAVPTGDWHLPNLVAWTLAGVARAGDDEMLEMLEPYRGHRGRVIRLVKACGRRPPRRGPRLPLRSIAGM